MSTIDKKNKRITIAPPSPPARPWPFEFADLARVAAELRASGEASLQISADLNNDEAGLLLHELTHKVGREVHFASRASDSVRFAV